MERYMSNKGPLDWKLLLAFTALSILRNLIWVVPSPLMGEVVASLSISLAQGGMLMYIVTVMMGVFMFLGSLMIDRVGASRAFGLSIFCLCFDGLLAVLSSSFYLVLLGRLMSGIGYGLSSSALVALVVERFDARQRLVINNYNAATNAAGMLLAYAVTIPLYEALGNSWQRLLLLWSLAALLLGVFFELSDRKNRLFHQSSAIENRANVLPMKGTSLAVAARMPSVRFMAIAMFGALWLYTGFNTYLPTALSAIHAIGADKASNITSVIFTGGLVSCLVSAVLFRKLRHPERLILLFGTGLLAGGLGTVLFPVGTWLTASVFLVGFCFFAWSTLAMTTLMNTPGMTPGIFSASVAFYTGTSSMLALFVPTVFGLLEARGGMLAAILFFGMLPILTVIGSGLLFLYTRRAGNKAVS